jgi:hypothetical protein
MFGLWTCTRSPPAFGSIVMLCPGVTSITRHRLSFAFAINRTAASGTPWGGEVGLLLGRFAALSEELAQRGCDLAGVLLVGPGGDPFD